MIDGASNFHPYDCNGNGKCPHCDRQHTDSHDPAVCLLCDPEYDFQPNPYWEERVA